MESIKGNDRNRFGLIQMGFRKHFIPKWLVPFGGGGGWGIQLTILRFTVYIAKYDTLYWDFSLC